ncbi:twin-arginine translocase TatA/TatE family subunit [Microbacterium sp. SA39]|uniref:twin-arginine translocase TatA/TatE family subunit n=1 Tax=Microbacterium sp. SA39 TaxID=1263625 RepID=UPI0005FA60AE|nr:twin-arginine translocase TatA/TatE family subunit [Microbacterium sp. SA39]KJQ53604.1 Sec-independent protein translocase protein TatB [Microbacterium sp. SA39]
MTFGLTFEKLLLIGLIAVLIIGPERLPRAAEGFSRWVRKAGEYVRDTKSKMRQEMGPELDDVDWRKLDPRQYDPRRIIRDALMEEPKPATPTQARATIAEPVAPRVPQVFNAENRPPYDPEST